ncbi:gas vesicle protein [Phytohabitans kaempferiae]|uniref:gas vesicle protein n=1 Tax=Phytohabitans kaempferiae TaxID=1620943 RepID=UPI00406BD0BF
MPQPAFDSGSGLAPTGGVPAAVPAGSRPPAGGDAGNLADVLERVLDRGVVIAGDIRVSLLDIELLTIKLRLVVASVDTAREMGIDWWEHDPFLTARPRRPVERDDEPPRAVERGDDAERGENSPARRSGGRERDSR